MKKRILYSGALFIGLVSVQSGFAQKKKSKTPQPVSYTHLTLPTNCTV